MNFLRKTILPLGALAVWLLGLMLGGCAGLIEEAYTPTPSLPPPTETTTIQWFPATNTATVFIAPSATATQDPLPGVGELLFSDDFSDPDLWDTVASGEASAQVTDGRLTLSLSEPRLTVTSLRTMPSLEDFYASVTAVTSLCKGNDQYGVVFRAAPGGNFYRFLLACNGSVRLERVRGGTVEIIQNWAASGDAPRGAPAEVKIGVWILGSEMHLLLNNHPEFVVRDPVFHIGRLGFFAYAGGDTPVIVSFRDLAVYSVRQIPPTPTLKATP